MTVRALQHSVPRIRFSAGLLAVERTTSIATQRTMTTPFSAAFISLFKMSACISQGVEEMRHTMFMNTYNIQLENPKGRDHLGYLVVGGGIILN
jgi:hypothetical protein